MRVYRDSAKAKKVLQLCETSEQLEVAKQYCELLLDKYELENSEIEDELYLIYQEKGEELWLKENPERKVGF